MGELSMKFDSSYLWSPRNAKWIILSLFAVLALLIVIEVGSVFTFHYWVNTTVLTEVKTPTPPVKPISVVENFDTELFGNYISPDMSTANVQESKLKLELVGILYSEKKEDSQVIIRSADGEEQHYKIGDKIPGNVIIKQIMADGVFVEHNGVLESLKLPENELTFEPPPKSINED
jgi:general secretion pathway protein C